MKPYNFWQEILYVFSQPDVSSPISHFPCCIMFVIFSSVLHYLWHCMRYEAEPGLLMTGLTSQPRTQRQERGHLIQQAPLGETFQILALRFDITFWGKTNLYIEYALCLTVYLPWHQFWCLCLFATLLPQPAVAPCWLGVSSGQSVARDTLVWQHPTPEEKTLQWILELFE